MTHLQILTGIICLIALAALIALVLIRRANRQFYRELEYLDARLKAEATERAAREEAELAAARRRVDKLYRNPPRTIPVGDPRHPAIRRAAGDIPSKRQPVIPQPTPERATGMRPEIAAPYGPASSAVPSTYTPEPMWPTPLPASIHDFSPAPVGSGGGGSFDGGGASSDWSSSSSDSSSSSSSDSASSSSSSGSD